MVRPSEQLQECIDGKRKPSPAFEFWCYRKFLELQKMPPKKANELLRQAPPHITREIRKWINTTGTTTYQRPRSR